MSRQEAASKQNTDSRSEQGAPPGNMRLLQDRVWQVVEEWGLTKQSLQLPVLSRDELEAQYGFSGREEGRATVLLEADCAMELGHPSTASVAMVLPSWSPDSVEEDRIMLIGRDLSELEHSFRHPFGLVLMLTLSSGANPPIWELERLLYLQHRLPGWVVRTMPGKQWVRISREAHDRGLTFDAVGSAIIDVCRQDLAESIRAVQVVFVTDSREHVEELCHIAREAAILAGRHHKLRPAADGAAECVDLSCETCDEQDVCDSLRDIIIKRRKRS